MRNRFEAGKCREGGGEKGLDSLSGSLPLYHFAPVFPQPGEIWIEASSPREFSLEGVRVPAVEMGGEPESQSTDWQGSPLLQLAISRYSRWRSANPM